MAEEILFAGLPDNKPVSFTLEANPYRAGLIEYSEYEPQLLRIYDAATKEWKGPIVEAPFNQAGVDGACPMFTAAGDKMIWSAGYDRGPGPVSTAGGTGSTYDLFWLPTSDVVAYYKAKAGLG